MEKNGLAEAKSSTLEKNDFVEAKSSPTAGSDALPIGGDAEPARGSFTKRFIDSFRRDPNAHVTSHGSGADGKTFDIEHAAENVSGSPLQRRLKARHLQMIAIGGAIGTGLFVGSGIGTLIRSFPLTRNDNMLLSFEHGWSGIPHHRL